METSEALAAFKLQLCLWLLKKSASVWLMFLKNIELLTQALVSLALNPRKRMTPRKRRMKTLFQLELLRLFIRRLVLKTRAKLTVL